VLRGGSWNNNPANLRSANRNRNTPDNRNNNNGFRLASTAHARAVCITDATGVQWASPGAWGEPVNHLRFDAARHGGGGFFGFFHLGDTPEKRIKIMISKGLC
jgi:hypothetical protein